MQGLQIGVVKYLTGDPESLSRIQVTLNSGTDGETDCWARMANPYAADGAGIVFLPEIGEDVIIGFIGNEPQMAVILGALQRSKNTSPLQSDKNNYKKAIITKSKLSITFNDDSKTISIKTPGGNSVTISDEDKSIVIHDQNDNSVTMTPKGISMESQKDISFNTKGNIVFDATGKITVKSKQDIELSGMNIKNNADVGFVAKGAATAEISASGQTVVKGATVMIN